LGLGSGVVIAAPCPEDSAVPALTVELALENALEVAAARGIAGKALTPFLLAHLADATDGATLRANLALLKNNARLAGEIAVAFGV
jgi:pseudouridylate synthase